MKIGVALSGCDIGGVAAYAILEELEQQGLGIAMISVCGLPAVTALPWAYGLGGEDCLCLAEDLLSGGREADLGLAVTELSKKITLRGREERCPIAVNAVNIADGKILTFTGGYRLASERVITRPIEGVYDILSATLSPMDGLDGYPLEEYTLCDYSVWYGCPVAPLRLAGMDKIVSAAFLPGTPETPYGVLAKQRIASTGRSADIHLALEPGEKTAREYSRFAAEAIRKKMKDLLIKIL